MLHRLVQGQINHLLEEGCSERQVLAQEVINQQEVVDYSVVLKINLHLAEVEVCLVVQATHH